MGQIPAMILQRDIVLLAFPFSDLRQSKVRPVIVLSNDKYNKRSKDIIAVPLTSRSRQTSHDMLITNENLDRGNLIADSRVKVDKIFNVERKLVKLKIGRIDRQTFDRIATILLGLVR